jgi:hypothetical protein
MRRAGAAPAARLCLTGPVTELLFSYGTLRQREVQEAIFGRAVEGTVFRVSTTDLAAADDYEVDDYRRITVPLRSGEQAGLRLFGPSRLADHHCPSWHCTLYGPSCWTTT